MISTRGAARLFAVSLLLLTLFTTGSVLAQEATPTPTVIPNWLTNAETPEERTIQVQTVVLLTVLVLAPSILLVATSFVRIVIVFSLLRQALGTQQLPPSQIVISLALIMTFFIMHKPIANMWEDPQAGIKRYTEGEIGVMPMLDVCRRELKDFMLPQTRWSDMNLFLKYQPAAMQYENYAEFKKEVPFITTVSAFILSELRRSFEMGFFLYLPFITIDMIVASILMSMGMMTLPPITISLPFKLLLFILVDGWNILTEALIRSFPVFS